MLPPPPRQTLLLPQVKHPHRQRRPRQRQPQPLRSHLCSPKSPQTAKKSPGTPAVDYQYLGKADDHDWSGRLVVIARGKDILTVLAMTYADSDLIQIQENVIARSITSLDFSVH